MSVQPQRRNLRALRIIGREQDYAAENGKRGDDQDRGKVKSFIALLHVARSLSRRGNGVSRAARSIGRRAYHGRCQGNRRKIFDNTHFLHLTFFGFIVDGTFSRLSGPSQRQLW